MTVKIDIDSFYELRRACWSCDSIFQDIEAAGKEDEMISFLDEIFSEGDSTMTDLNDYIRFDLENDAPWLFGEEEEDEDEEEDELEAEAREAEEEDAYDKANPDTYDGTYDYDD